jgi:hypothetical protein
VNSGPRRGVALLAVIVLHTGLVAVVALALHNRDREIQAPEVISLTFLDLAPPAAEPWVPQGKPPFASRPSSAITLPPMTPPEAQERIDWDAEARGAANEATGARRVRPFGRNPATQAAPAPGGPESAVHHAGEQYRDADGTSVVFISDHCFIASSPPPPGTPDVIARGIPTRTVCRGDPGWSRADLFKDLPAYGRYHQLPPPRP